MESHLTSPESTVDAEPVWRAMFCSLYSTSRPVLELDTIMHWRGVVGEHGASSPMGSQRALVMPGYFYRPHSVRPSRAELDEAVERSREADAPWVLVPTVRQDEHDEPDNSPIGHGTVTLPWFIEAEYRVRSDVQSDLRAQLGGDRFRELRRMNRRVDESYSWEVITGDRLVAEPRLLRPFERLHEHNIARYGHQHNHFSGLILDALLAAPIAEKLCIFQFHRRADERPMQAALGLWHRDAGTLEFLVQGIDHAEVPPQQNLYAAALYRTYHWGVENGVNVFNLGRGAAATKLGLGANTFHILGNQLIAADLRADLANAAQLRAIREDTTAAAMDQLRERAAGHDAGHVIPQFSRKSHEHTRKER